MRPGLPPLAAPALADATRPGVVSAFELGHLLPTHVLRFERGLGFSPQQGLRALFASQPEAVPVDIALQ